jgi:outer membrane protein
MSGRRWVTRLRAIGVSSLLVGMFGGPPLRAADLLEVYRLARENDPTLAGEHYQLEASEQSVPEAASALLPVLSANSQVDRTGGDVTYTANPTSTRQYNSVIWTLQLTVPLLRPGSIQDFREAHTARDQARTRYALAEQDLLLRVAQAYFEVVIAEEVVAAADAEVRAMNEQHAVASKSYQKGVVSVTDVDQATSRAELAVSSQLAATADLETKRSELEKIIGPLPLTLDGLAKGSVTLAPNLDGSDDWARRASENSLKVLGLESAVQIARLEVQKARMQRLPTVDAVASYGRNYSSGNSINPLDYGTNAYVKQAGVQFNLPLLDGGGMHARMAEAMAKERKAQSDLEAARREAAADAREAYQGVLKGVAQVKALSAAIEASENAVKGSQAGYRLGIRINSDVLDAQRERYSAQRDWAKARYDTLIQFLKLKAAAGVLQRSDLTTINSLLAVKGD